MMMILNKNDKLSFNNQDNIQKRIVFKQHLLQNR